MREANWWVDASFPTHYDMKSHTGSIMSLGKVATYATSETKFQHQKFN